MSRHGRCMHFISNSFRVCSLVHLVPRICVSSRRRLLSLRRRDPALDLKRDAVGTWNAEASGIASNLEFCIKDLRLRLGLS